MKKNLLMLAVASSCFFAVHANAMTSNEHKVAKEKIEADYKVAKAQCDALKDNAKDVCEEEAKGKEKIGLAELEQAYKPSSSNQRKVDEVKNDAAYEVAKEKCDDQSGDAKSACEKQAEADHAKGKADIKAKKY